MISRFVVPPAVFTDLPAGASCLATISFLQSTQLSKHLHFVRIVARSTSKSVEPAVEVLAEAQRRSPSDVKELLLAPCVGAWGARFALRLRDSATPEPPPAEAGYLSALAVAAAIHTGVDADLVLWTQDGRAFIPGLGSAVFPGSHPAPVRCRIRDGEAVLEAGGQKVAVPTEPSQAPKAWLPLHRLTATAEGRRITLVLDDLDPFRACYRMPVAGRMPSSEVELWRERFQQAWQVLVRWAPDRATELTGLRAMVPLSAEETETGLSATSRTAFGMLALTLPARAVHLAITLVHEFQHSKLSALEDLLPLHDPSGPRRYFAPWRPDARPIGGLLRGAHAFLAVCDVWDRLRASAEAAEAERHFAELREQVNSVVETMLRSSHLYENGRAFVTAMHSALRRQLAVPLPAAATRAARAVLDDLRERWDARNPGLSVGS